MTPELVMDYLGAFCLALGAAFCLAAALGLVRFPDPLTRMHAATKPSVFGLLLLLAGVALSLRDAKVFTLLTIAVLMQVMTAPVSGHLITRTAQRTGQWDAEHAAIDELTDDQMNGSGAFRAPEPRPTADPQPSADSQPPPDAEDQP